MKPSLSIIVTTYNHAELLGGLFSSILAQTLKDIEVVLIDDCSSISCDSIIAEYSKKGLSINYWRSPVRLYTKNARLKGIELAQAEIIAFADADDYFTEAETLENFVQIYNENALDVLHFRTLHVNEHTGITSYHTWADPFGVELNGEQIFTTYSRYLSAHVMWNKLYSRKLWLKHMQAARDINIKICSEDLFLSSFYLFHAKKYKGIADVGYAHIYADKTQQKSPCRAEAFYIIQQEFIPYLKNHGCPQTALNNFERQICKWLQSYTNTLCQMATTNQPLAGNINTASGPFATLDPKLILPLLVNVATRNAQSISDATTCIMYANRIK